MTQAPQQATGSPERLLAYTDAVVAIAQTLLILPLLESVSDAKAHHLSTSEWLGENVDMLIWFLMSFGLIGSFWFTHNRVFRHIEHPTELINLFNLMWMLSIVFQPVATALLGLGQPEPVQFVLYIGSLLLCNLAMNLIVWQLLRDPRLGNPENPLRASQVAASLSQTLLTVLALVIALVVGKTEGYYAMFVMTLMPLMVRLFRPVVKRLGWGA